MLTPVAAGASGAMMDASDGYQEAYEYATDELGLTMKKLMLLQLLGI